MNSLKWMMVLKVTLHKSILGSLTFNEICLELILGGRIKNIHLRNLSKERYLTNFWIFMKIVPVAAIHISPLFILFTPIIY